MFLVFKKVPVSDYNKIRGGPIAGDGVSVARGRERERERHIDTDRQKDKDTERQRERERERNMHKIKVTGKFVIEWRFQILSLFQSTGQDEDCSI